jgi:hypothetical protein
VIALGAGVPRVHQGRGGHDAAGQQGMGVTARRAMDVDSSVDVVEA